MRQRTAVERRGKRNELTRTICSDFGSFKIVPDRNLDSTEHVFFLDMDYFSLNVLRDWSVVELAKTGDATKQMLLYEAGLCSKNEKASGILADCAA